MARSKKPGYQISIAGEVYDAAKKFVDGKPEFEGARRGGQPTFSVGKLADKLITEALDASEKTS